MKQVPFFAILKWYDKDDIINELPLNSIFCVYYVEAKEDAWKYKPICEAHDINGYPDDIYTLYISQISSVDDSTWLSSYLFSSYPSQEYCYT